MACLGLPEHMPDEVVKVASGYESRYLLRNNFCMRRRGMHVLVRVSGAAVFRDLHRAAAVLRDRFSAARQKSRQDRTGWGQADRGDAQPDRGAAQSSYRVYAVDGVDPFRLPQATRGR